jgi:hypothetical protein
MILLAAVVTVTTATTCLAEGALALGNDRFGMSVGHRSRHEAEKIALEDCRSSSCKVVMTYANECAALAFDGYDARGWGRDNSRQHAEHRALEECRKRSGHPHRCEVRAARCDGR